MQVTKGPIGTKGPRVTTNLVLPGRFLVLLPNSDQSGISRKIENIEERKRLKKILRELHIPDGMGVIIVSDDLPELLQNCDRIMVMRKGTIAKVFDAEQVDEDTLYHALVTDEPSRTLS